MQRPFVPLALIALAVAIVIAPLFTDRADAYDVIVAAGPVPCATPGAPASIFATIQDGVNAAPPGGSVGVCPGTYVEQVAIGTAGLTVVGIGVVEVRAPAGPGPKFGLEVTADNVTIRRFNVGGFTDDPDSCGIAVNGAADVAVENNRVHDNSVGICLLSANRGRVRNNVATANAGAGFGGGIRVRFGADNEVAGNTVRANVWEGIVDEAAIASKIHHNLSVANGATGIILNSSTNSEVTNNTLRGNVNGVVAGFTDGAVIEHNYASGNGTGVHVFTSTACVVRLNATPFNIVDGVSVREVSSCSVTRNVSHRNQRHGIAALTLGAGNVFERNAASHNADLDCDWDLSDGPVFVRNACGTTNPPGVW